MDITTERIQIKIRPDMLMVMYQFIDRELVSCNGSLAYNTTQYPALNHFPPYCEILTIDFSVISVWYSL